VRVWSKKDVTKYSKLGVLYRWADEVAGVAVGFKHVR
jgi:hypothetical protein